MSEWRGWTAPPLEGWASGDPGKDHVGLALWRGTKLVRAKKLVIPDGIGWPSGIVHLGMQAYAFAMQCGITLPIRLFVGEFPEIRFATGEEFKAKDLLTLGPTLGAVAMGLHAQVVEDVPPSRWKGNIDADVVCRRTQEKITAAGELGLLEGPRNKKGEHDHNLLDGCGVGLWRCGRLHPERR